MKRSFRVATVFTGAVATAAALAPAADAATVAPNTVTAGNCISNQDGGWVHLYYSANAHHSVAACIRNGPGYFSFIGGKKFAGICGGHWSGSFWYGVPGKSISGVSNFAPGYEPVRWHQADEIYWVHLVRYFNIAEDSCPRIG
jgi:hypothetical protein